MREITLGDTKVRVRATPLALLFYKQEFKTDLLGDLTKMSTAEKDVSKIDTVALLQLIWVMAKADTFPDKFPSFVEWVSSLKSIDLSDPTFILAAVEEAAAGFLGKKPKPIKK